MRNKTVFSAIIWMLLQITTCVVGQQESSSSNSATSSVSPDIVTVGQVDLDSQSFAGDTNSLAVITLDASRLGTGTDFYSRASLVLQIGDKTKTFHRVSGDTDNNNHFVGESEGGDSLQLLKHTSAATGNQILIGSLVELDTALVYQFKSKPHDSNSNEIILEAKVRPSNEFPMTAEPPTLDSETAELMEKFHNESMQPGYTFATMIPEDPTPTISSAKAKSYKKDTDIISIMILWSKKSECRYSDLPADCDVNEETEDNMRALIDAAVAETNTAYNMSKIGVQLELVHAYRHPTYTESAADSSDILNVGVFGNTLARMSIPLDGTLDDVQWKRRKYRADMVSMFIDDPSYCGVGYIGTGFIPAPSAPFMYSIVAYDCATGM